MNSGLKQLVGSEVMNNITSQVFERELRFGDRYVQGPEGVTYFNVPSKRSQRSVTRRYNALTGKVVLEAVESVAQLENFARGCRKRSKIENFDFGCSGALRSMTVKENLARGYRKCGEIAKILLEAIGSVVRLKVLILAVQGRQEA